METQKLAHTIPHSLKKKEDIENTFYGHSNRIYCVKFDALNENIIYSGGWSSYVVINDIRCKGDEKVADIFGPYICGDSIDTTLRDNQLLIGSYGKDHYLNVYDTRNLTEITKIEEIKWGNSFGKEDFSGFIYSTKFWNNLKSDTIIMAGSAKTEDLKLFSHQFGKGKKFEEVCHITGIGSGVLSIDSGRNGKILAYGTVDGEVTLLNAKGFSDSDELM